MSCATCHACHLVPSARARRGRLSPPLGASSSRRGPNRSLHGRGGCRHFGPPSRLSDRARSGAVTGRGSVRVRRSGPGMEVGGSTDGAREDPLRRHARMIPTVPIGPHTRRGYWGPRWSRDGTVGQLIGQGAVAPNGPWRVRPITVSIEGQVRHDGAARTAPPSGPNQGSWTGLSTPASDRNRDQARTRASALGPLILQPHRWPTVSGWEDAPSHQS